MYCLVNFPLNILHWFLLYHDLLLYKHAIVCTCKVQGLLFEILFWLVSNKPLTLKVYVELEAIGAASAESRARRILAVS